MSKIDKYTAEQILNLSGSYAATDLRTAYRHAIKNNHPDKVIAAGGDPQAANAKMADINAAHDYLESVFATTGKTRLDCAPEPFEPVSEAAAGYEPDFHPVVVEKDIIDPDEAARINAAYAAADNLRAQADAKEAAYAKEPLWYAFAKPVAEHAPYRIIFMVAALVFMSCVVGVNMFATMGLAPAGWTPADVNAGLFLFSIGWFLAAFINLIVPFATHPIRKGVLNLVERKRWEAKERTAEEAAAEVAAQATEPGA